VTEGNSGWLMDKFVALLNIAHYVKLLKSETNCAKRGLLQKLLAEEKTKQSRSPYTDKS
jgi:hypothetical protein